MKKKLSRMTVFTVMIVFIFILIASRVFYIQVLSGEYFRGVSEAMTETAVSEIPPRGEILDKNFEKLATNVQSYNINYSLSREKSTDDEINRILIGAVEIICDFGDKGKLNVDSLPITYDEKYLRFSFSFNSKDPDVVNSLARKFKKDVNIDETLNAEQTLFKLAENYKLISDYQDGHFQNTYGISNDIIHRVVALRLAVRAISYKQYEPIYIAKNVKKQTAFKIQFESNKLEGVSSEVVPLRYYPYGQVGSNFIGYVGKISSNIEEYSKMGYDVSSELIGKDGLEKVLENNKELDIKLRGEPGVKYTKVDKLGKVINDTAWLDATPGDTVITTIDIELQKVAEEAFDKTMQNIRDGAYSKKESYPNANRGAMVVLDVNTGEILALVSRPGYDPNLFASTGGVDPDTYNTLFLPDKKDPYDTLPRPMFNYATQGTAPPGSTLKPFSAIAGLQEGAIKPGETINDLGIYNVVKGFNGKCWIYDDKNKYTHGPVDVIQALQVSCNYFFFEVGRRLGYDKIGTWASKFGLGREGSTKPVTGLEIYERTGTVGSPLTYKNIWINSVMKKITDALAEPVNGGYTLMEGTKEYTVLEDILMDGYLMYDDSKLVNAGLLSTKEKNEYITQDYKSRLMAFGITNKKALNLILNGDRVGGNVIVPGAQIFDSQASRPGDPLNTAIGQGETSLTPLQMAQYLATLLNGGTRYKAHLVKKVLYADGSLKKEVEPEVLSKVELNPAYVDIVKEGMRKVTEEGGTASNIFKNYPVECGGKTGTAQWSNSSEIQAQYGRSAYGWFIGFAPYDKPEIAVVAVIYDGGHGNYVGHAVKEVFDKYFKIENTNPPVQQVSGD
jgi:penicillin-binding protein 2